MAAFTKEKKKEFLGHFAKNGRVGKSAKAVGIGRQTAYDAKAKDEEFATGWAAAFMYYLGRLEDVVAKNARKDARLALRVLERRHPDWKPSAAIQHDATGDFMVVIEELAKLEEARRARLA